MFPTPIEKSSRQWQIGYQIILPCVLVIWLLPLIAVAMFSIKPDADFANGNYWGLPSSFEMFNNYGNPNPDGACARSDDRSGPL